MLIIREDLPAKHRFGDGGQEIHETKTESRNDAIPGDFSSLLRRFPRNDSGVLSRHYEPCVGNGRGKNKGNLHQKHRCRDDIYFFVVFHEPVFLVKGNDGSFLKICQRHGFKKPVNFPVKIIVVEIITNL